MYKNTSVVCVTVAPRTNTIRGPIHIVALVNTRIRLPSILNTPVYHIETLSIIPTHIGRNDKTDSPLATLAALVLPAMR